MTDRIAAEATVGGSSYLVFDPPVAIPKALMARPRVANSLGVMEVLDRRNANATEVPEWRAELEKVLHGKLPAGVRVEERGDIILRFWTDDLGDEAALRAACKRYQQWIVKTVP